MSATVNLHAHEGDQLTISARVERYEDGRPYVTVNLCNHVAPRMGGMIDWVAGLACTPDQAIDFRNALDMIAAELAGVEPEPEPVASPHVSARHHVEGEWDDAIDAAEADTLAEARRAADDEAGYEGPSFGPGDR